MLRIVKIKSKLLKNTVVAIATLLYSYSTICLPKNLDLKGMLTSFKESFHVLLSNAQDKDIGKMIFPFSCLGQIIICIFLIHIGFRLGDYFYKKRRGER